MVSKRDVLSDVKFIHLLADNRYWSLLCPMVSIELLIHKWLQLNSYIQVDLKLYEVVICVAYYFSFSILIILSLVTNKITNTFI